MMPRVRHYCLLPDVVCVTMCNDTLEQMKEGALVLANTHMDDPEFHRKMPRVVIFMNLRDHPAAKKQLERVMEGNTRQIELAFATFARFANNLRVRWKRRDVKALFESPPGFCGWAPSLQRVAHALAEVMGHSKRYAYRICAPNLTVSKNYRPAEGTYPLIFAEISAHVKSEVMDSVLNLQITIEIWESSSRW